MFGFSAKPPLDKKTQDWIDHGFERLGIILGKERMLKVDVILPTDQYFPDKYEKNEAGLEVLFQRVCLFMSVERPRVELSLIPDHVESLREHIPYWSGQSAGAAGLYEGNPETAIPIVSVRETLASEPMVAVAVMAHELAHVILLGENLIDPESKDMEPTTDLATVFMGLGIFTANAAFRYEKHQNSRKVGWSVSRTGYLSEEMFGHALAKFTVERNELRPAWSKHLASNIRSHFDRSLKWLAGNGARPG